MEIDMLSFSLSTATDVFPIMDANLDFSFFMMFPTSPASITSQPFSFYTTVSTLEMSLCWRSTPGTSP